MGTEVLSTGYLKPFLPFLGSILIFAAILSFSGCSAGLDSSVDTQEVGPGGIRLGMTRQEVVETMLDDVRMLQMSGQAKNPYATRFLNGLRDEQLEVMYYYTGMKRPDDRVTAEELVPVILKDDSVIGWGWQTLEAMTGDRSSP